MIRFRKIFNPNLSGMSRTRFSKLLCNLTSIVLKGMNQNYGGYGGGGMVGNSGMFPDQTLMRTPEYQQRMRPPYMQVSFKF